MLIRSADDGDEECRKITDDEGEQQPASDEAIFPLVVG